MTEHAAQPVNDWILSREKRAYDIAGAATALVIAAPIIAVSALATAVRDKKNPFFVQQRIGKDGEKFSMFKIRTLEETGDYSGVGQGPQDSRATRLGAFLRDYAIDELPQLWNVIKGDMSLVGPRPPCGGEVEVMEESLTPDEFSAWKDAYMAGRPGLVSRYAVETRFTPPEERSKPEFYKQRTEWDQEYTSNADRMHDLQLCSNALGIAVKRLRHAASVG